MTEIVIIVALTLVNGVFAMSEAAILSARKARLQQQVDRGDAGARTALALKQDSTRFLSTVQVGITLVGTLLGAFGGATIANDIARSVRMNETLAPYADTIGLLLVVAAVSYLQLIIGELVPKQLAVQSPEAVATAISQPMQFLSVVTSPVVKLLTLSTRAVLWLLGAGNTKDTPPTEEEVSALIQEGVHAGVFDVSEHEMVESVFKLGERRVTSIMTPRTETVWLDLEDPPEENQRKIAESHFSRFPVCEGSLDNVVGMVRAKDLLPRILSGEGFDVRASMVPPIFVPESMYVSRAVELFRETGKHIIFVVGEYGGLQGLVTTQDILEEIVGDIDEPEAVQREDGSYLVDGLMAVEDFKELLDIDELPGEDDLFETVGGFFMAQQGKVPRAGDHFVWEKLRFEVVDMDGNRIDKVMVARIVLPEPTPPVPKDAKPDKG
ncbi:MAG: hemolysin family protein [Chloroflexota bacterium]|nr:hemolysin family protein [Chloroflexota bacterium]